MTGKRKTHSAMFNDQVSLAALKDDRTVNELASHYGVQAGPANQTVHQRLFRTIRSLSTAYWVGECNLARSSGRRATLSSMA